MNTLQKAGIITLLGIGIGTAKAKAINLFIYGGVGINPRNELNSEIEKISDGSKMPGLNYMGGLEATIKNFGIGLNYNLGNKVDTSLTGLDHSQINTGNVSVKNMQFYGIAQKLWEIGKSVNLGGYANVGGDYEFRVQKTGDNEYRVNTLNLKTSGGAIATFGKGKTKAQLKAGYGTHGAEIQAGIRRNI